MLVTMPRLSALPVRACQRPECAPPEERQLLDEVRLGATGRDFYPGIRQAVRVADFLGLAQDSTTRLYLAAELARERHARLQGQAVEVVRLLHPELDERSSQDRVCQLTQAAVYAESRLQAPVTIGCPDGVPRVLTAEGQALPLVDLSLLSPQQRREAEQAPWAYQPAESRFCPESSRFTHDPVATIEAIRAQLDDPGRKLNVAYAELDLSGRPLRQLAAVSSYRGAEPLFPYEQTVSFPGPRVERSPRPDRQGEGFFAHDLGDGNPRTFDSEVRLLDQLDLPAGAVGTLRLYTERETCQSCRGVLEAFRLRHPGLRLEVVYGRCSTSRPAR